MYLNSLGRAHFAGMFLTCSTFSGARRRSRSSLRRCNWVWNVATRLSGKKKPWISAAALIDSLPRGERDPVHKSSALAKVLMRGVNYATGRGRRRGAVSVFFFRSNDGEDTMYLQDSSSLFFSFFFKRNPFFFLLRWKPATLRCWVMATLRTSQLACYSCSCFIFISCIVITAARGGRRKKWQKLAGKKKIQFQQKPRHAFLNLKIIKVWDEYTKNSSRSLCGINVCFIFCSFFVHPLRL